MNTDLQQALERDHLFVAIMRDGVDLLDAKAPQLLDTPQVWPAFGDLAVVPDPATSAAPR